MVGAQITIPLFRSWACAEGVENSLGSQVRKSDPTMLREWAESNNEASSRLLKILVKYAEIDREKIIEEMATLDDELSKKKDQTIITKFKAEMKERLKKHEEIMKI